MLVVELGVRGGVCRSGASVTGEGVMVFCGDWVLGWFGAHGSPIRVGGVLVSVVG